MEQPGEGHGHGVVGEEESNDRLSKWRWGPFVLILLTMPVFVANLLTNKMHPADDWLRNIQTILIIAAAVWSVLSEVSRKGKR